MPTNEPLPNIGGVITDRLEVAGLTRTDLVNLTGIKRSTLRRRLISGLFTLPELDAIAAALNIKASDLIAEAEQVAA